MSDPSALLNVRQAAALVGLSAGTLHRYYRDGRLPAVELPSGRLRFLRDDLQALITPTLKSQAGRE